MTYAWGYHGLCKVLERSVVFSAFYADVCLGLKSVIITILNTRSASMKAKTSPVQSAGRTF